MFSLSDIIQALKHSLPFAPNTQTLTGNNNWALHAYVAKIRNKDFGGWRIELVVLDMNIIIGIVNLTNGSDSFIKGVKTGVVQMIKYTFLSPSGAIDRQRYRYCPEITSLIPENTRASCGLESKRAKLAIVSLLLWVEGTLTLVHAVEFG